MVMGCLKRQPILLIYIQIFYIESVYFIKIETKYKNCAFLRKSVTSEKIITKNCSNNL